MTAALLDVVASELERRDVGTTTDQVSALVQYLELLEHWARRINLTGQPRADWIAGRLLPDALVLVHALDPQPRSAPGTGLAVVDVGSGNGVIGLVLALLRPVHDVLLVEPSQKRCTFLRTVVHQLRLSQVTIAEQRLETLLQPPSRDLALSRATWAPETWLARARRLVYPGRGQIGAFLGGQTPPLVPDLVLERSVPYALNDGTERQLVLYRRR